MNSLFSKIKEFFSIIKTKVYDISNSFHSPSQSNSLNEEELIDSIAKKIITCKLEVPAVLILGMFTPMSYFFTNMFFRPIAPLFSLADVDAYQYVNLLEKTENLEKIMNILENHRDNLKKSKEGRLKPHNHENEARPPMNDVTNPRKS